MNANKEARPHNSSYPKGGVLCSKDSFVVNGSLVFQIKFSGNNPATSGNCKPLSDML